MGYEQVSTTSDDPPSSPTSSNPLPAPATSNCWSTSKDPNSNTPHARKRTQHFLLALLVCVFVGTLVSLGREQFLVDVGPLPTGVGTSNSGEAAAQLAFGDVNGTEGTDSEAPGHTGPGVGVVDGADTESGKDASSSVSSEPEVKTTAPTQYKERKRVLYWNRHEGTRHDMDRVAELLDLDITHVAPGMDYGLTPPCMRDKECGESYITALCSAYDFIVVGDVNTDGEVFLTEACLQTQKKGKVQIVFQTTNRFDFNSKPPHTWHQTLQSALTNHPTRVHLVVNNPYELYFMCRRAVHPPKYALIRPTGWTPPITDAADVPLGDDQTVAITQKSHTDDLMPKILSSLNITHRILGSRYGGPKTLATYKAYIHYPYQVSVMSFHENLRQGVAYLLPSAKFFASLCRADENFDFWGKRDLCDETPASRDAVHRLVDWAEWWQPELASHGVVKYFHSWGNLKEVLEAPGIDVELMAMKERARLWIREVEVEVVRRWGVVFGILEEEEGKEGVWMRERIDC
ncbi:hypothetical protein HDV00_012659 [Rhizophlyctis rosea]|nr:hypothetical protein HDV00_012659 [Rhizophlyctis rosea]